MNLSTNKEQVPLTFNVQGVHYFTITNIHILQWICMGYQTLIYDTTFRKEPSRKSHRMLLYVCVSLWTVPIRH
jgi:hypothetical protein